MTTSDSIGNTWTYTYDSAGRRITEHDPLVESPTDKFTTYQYDKNSNLIREKDNKDLVTTHTYDDLVRLIKTTQDPNGLNISITYDYDGASNLIQISDDNGNVTNNEFDAANRLKRKHYADGTDMMLTYDIVGNITSQTDQMDNVTTYTYDDLGRLIEQSYANGRKDIFAYDRTGNILIADNNNSHIQYSYDDLSRVTTSTQTDLPQTYSSDVNYAYSEIPNRRTLTYPGGKIVVEEYDVRNRLKEVWQNGVKTTWYTYDTADRLLTKSLDNSAHSEYDYDDNDSITNLRHFAIDGTTTFAGFSHDYDAMGRRLNAQNLQTVLPYDSARPVTQSEKYTYDSIYRLADFKRGQWVGNDIPSPTRNRDWQFDGVQNWTQFGIDGQTYQNSINQMNEYDDPSNDGPAPIPDDDGYPEDFMADVNILKIDLDGNGEINLGDFAIVAMFWLDGSCSAPNWCGGADFNHDGFIDEIDLDFLVSLWLKKAGFNFAYDKNGNRVDDDVREYFYDYDHRPINEAALRAGNQLTMVKEKSSGSVLAQYWYDAMGRRIRKLAGGVSTVYVYSDNWQVLEEYENSSSLARSYTYGNSIDEVLTLDRAVEADRLYYHDNALGSIIAVSNGSGVTAERYSYDAYGQPSFADGSGNVIIQSAIGNPYLFTGRRYDDETSLYNYRTRYLDPIAGRFITRDTIGMWGDVSNLGNGYTYVANSPVDWVDPFGKKTAKKPEPDQANRFQKNHMLFSRTDPDKPPQPMGVLRALLRWVDVPLNGCNSRVWFNDEGYKYLVNESYRLFQILLADSLTSQEQVDKHENYVNSLKKIRSAGFTGFRTGGRLKTAYNWYLNKHSKLGDAVYIAVKHCYWEDKRCPCVTIEQSDSVSIKFADNSSYFYRFSRRIEKCLAIDGTGTSESSDTYSFIDSADNGKHGKENVSHIRSNLFSSLRAHYPGKTSNEIRDIIRRRTEKYRRDIAQMER